MTKLKHPCLLVVDSNPDSRALYTWMLEDAGAEVVVTASAREALAALASFQPDALLCDLVMPEIDGYMLISKLRKSSVAAWQQIPAIAVSALSGDEYYQQALASGFQRYIMKPINLDQLIAAINEVIQPKTWAIS